MMIHLTSGVNWDLAIGDPYPLAWATVGAYFLAAVGCGLCARRADQIFSARPLGLHRVIWWSMCAVLTFLGINKQLDLQTLFTQIVKIFASRTGLYEMGRHAQKYFVLGLALISAGGIGWAAWKVRLDWRRYIVLVLGALLIVRFVLVRVGSFYGVRIPSMSVLPGIKMNGFLEIAGALTIAGAAFLNLKFSRKNRLS